MAGITCKPDGIDEGTKIKSQNLVIQSTSVKFSGISPTVGRVLTCTNVDGSTQWYALPVTDWISYNANPTLVGGPFNATVSTNFSGMYKFLGLGRYEIAVTVQVQATVGGPSQNPVRFNIDLPVPKVSLWGNAADFCATVGTIATSIVGDVPTNNNFPAYVFVDGGTANNGFRVDTVVEGAQYNRVSIRFIYAP